MAIVVVVNTEMFAGASWICLPCVSPISNDQMQ